MTPAAQLDPAVSVALALQFATPPIVGLVVSSVNRLAFVPVMDIVTLVALVEPLFVNVTDNSADAVLMTTLPKLSVEVDRAIWFTPVPLSGTVCGLPGAVSVKLRLADSAPMTVGVYVTVTAHVAPDASVPPHVPPAGFVVKVKSDAFVPVEAIPEMVMDEPEPTQLPPLHEPLQTLTTPELVCVNVTLPSESDETSTEKMGLDEPEYI